MPSVHAVLRVLVFTEAPQDQTVKVAEARDLETDLQRVREENAELRKRLNEVSSLESAKKKADSRIEQLEQKVYTSVMQPMQAFAELSSDR